MSDPSHVLKHAAPGLVALAATAAVATPSTAELVYGLTTENSVAVFDTAAPGVTLDGGFVQGIAPGESLLAIDYRAATGELYLLGSQNNFYLFDPVTFDASLVGNFAPPSLRGTSFALDFNPAFMDGEFARIISDTDNNRVISGETGQYLGTPDKTPVFYAAGDPNEGENPNIAGIAYTNSFGIPDSTQQYGIDASLGVLTTVANNDGTLETVGLLGAMILTNEVGFDILGTDNTGFAALQTGINSSLFTVDLTTGAATEIGEIASGDIIRSLAVVPIPEPTTAAIAGVGLGLLGLRRRR